MSTIFKYAVVLVIPTSILWIYGLPNFENVLKMAILDVSSINIKSILETSTPEFQPVDAAAAARVDEDLDYRIAQRVGSSEAWRTFIAAHGSSDRAQRARAELKSLNSDEMPPAQDAEDVLTDARGAGDIKRPASPSTAEAATLAPDRSGERMDYSAAVTDVLKDASPIAPTENVAAQPARPPIENQVASLTPNSVVPVSADSPLPPTRERSLVQVPKSQAMPPDETHRTESAHRLKSKRHARGCVFRGAACYWRGQERLVNAYRGRKLFAFFPLHIRFGDVKMASR